MIYIPNRGGVSPLTTSYSGNAQISNAVGGTGFFTAPSHVDTATLGRFRIAFPIYGYPQPALDLVMVKTWQLDAALSGGSLNISASAEFDVPDAVTLIDRLTDDKAKSISINQLETGSGSEQLLLQVSGMTLFGISFAADTAEWQLGMEIFVGYSNGDGDTSSCGRGASYDPSNGVHTGVTFTLGNQEIELYVADNDSTLPSGTVTLTPVDWFR
jgi:hypothetical protein